MSTGEALHIPTREERQQHQQRVAETIRRTARWRRTKADDHPAQHRENRRSANALRTLANFVENLAPDDPDLNTMRWSRPTADNYAYRLSTEAFNRLARFGYNRGAYNTGPTSEAQLRNILRRVEGAEAQSRHLMRQRTT